jgi:hypothetical protein
MYDAVHLSTRQWGQLSKWCRHCPRLSGGWLLAVSFTSTSRRTPFPRLGIVGFESGPGPSTDYTGHTIARWRYWSCMSAHVNTLNIAPQRRSRDWSMMRADGTRMAASIKASPLLERRGTLPDPQVVTAVRHDGWCAGSPADSPVQCSAVQCRAVQFRAVQSRAKPDSHLRWLARALLHHPASPLHYTHNFGKTSFYAAARPRIQHTPTRHSHLGF